MTMTFEESVTDTWRSEAEILDSLAQTVDKGKLELLMGSILECKGKIITSGCGTSGTAAMKIAHTLSCVECPALFLSPAAALHGGLGLAEKEDLVILISKGGNSGEMDLMLNAVREKGAFTVAVTENEDSMLAKGANLFLKIKVKKEPDDFNMLATGSTIAVIAVFDALAISVMRIRGYDKRDFLRIHPGGQVGKLLAAEMAQ